MENNNNNNETISKIIILGDTGVGKKKFITNFYDNINKDIINEEYRFKSHIVDKSIKIKYQLYLDKSTGGSGSNSSAYRNAQCFILMFDVCDKDSMQSVKFWMRDAVKFSSFDIPTIVIGNKADQTQKRTIDKETAIDFIREMIESLGLKMSIPYFEFNSMAPKQSEYDRIFNKMYRLINERFNKRLTLNTSTGSSSSMGSYDGSAIQKGLEKEREKEKEKEKTKEKNYTPIDCTSPSSDDEKHKFNFKKIIFFWK